MTALKVVFGMFAGFLLSGALLMTGCHIHIALNDPGERTWVLFAMWANQAFWFTPLCVVTGAVVGAYWGKEGG